MCKQRPEPATNDFFRFPHDGRDEFGAGRNVLDQRLRLPGGPDTGVRLAPIKHERAACTRYNLALPESFFVQKVQALHDPHRGFGFRL